MRSERQVRDDRTNDTGGVRRAAGTTDDTLCETADLESTQLQFIDDFLDAVGRAGDLDRAALFSR
jgi:hypothetical protein